MTDREALKLLKYPVYKWSMDWDDREDGLSYTEAIEQSISAIQERIDREKGCEWCKDLANPHWRGQHLALIEGDSFCRKCGRKLKTAMPVDGIMRDLSGAVIKGEHTEPFTEYDHSGENTAMPEEVKMNGD